MYVLTEPRFLSAGKLVKLLRIVNRHRVWELNQLEIIPCLYITRRQSRTRLYPTIYCIRLAEYLGERSATPTRIERFNAHPGTLRLITEACEEFESTLKDQERHTPTQVEELLCVGHKALEGWLRSGALAFEIDASTRRRIITSQMIRDATKWVLPR